MNVTLWGTRGSIASPGPDTVRYGGNTSCISAMGSEGTLLVFDAGTGIRVLGQNMPSDPDCIHIFLTHLHMDHVQGLPFFEPLRKPGFEVHIWGPASTTRNLEARVLRYLSPPLFPVRTRDLLSTFHYHELGTEHVEIGEFKISAQMILHPNPTIGYRVQDGNSFMAYLPDHEPVLGAKKPLAEQEWISGYDLAAGADLLIHDAQYTSEEYQARLGFGHSSIKDAIKFASRVGAKQLVPFHHDPSHSDDLLDRIFSDAIDEYQPDFVVSPGKEGNTYSLP